MSSSIYEKTCPTCSAGNTPPAERCTCGHAFLADETSVDPQQIGEAELFQEYLRARVDQAVAALEAARDELARQPKNIDKAMRVLKAVRDADQCRSELVAQTVQTRQMRETLDTPQAGAALQSAQPGEAFRATQAARAEQIMAQFEGTTTKTCPQCETTLPSASVLCFCGHRFAGAANHPRQRTTDQQAVPNAWQA